MKHLKSLMIGGMAFQVPMVKNREICNILSKDKALHLDIKDIKRTMNVSPIAETIEDNKLDDIERTIFLEIYNKHKKLGDFPKEKIVGTSYFSELEKDLKINKNPNVRRVARVIDSGLKLAVLAYTYNQIQNSNFSFGPNMINMNNFVKTFSFITNSLAVINLMEAGSSKLFGLENMRHGTSITNYPKIMLQGGDPTKGGNISGSSQPWGNKDVIKDSKNYFHLFLDRYGEEERERVLESNEKLKQDVFHCLVKRLNPRLHAALSGFQSMHPNNNKKKNFEKNLQCKEEIDGVLPIKNAGKTLGAIASVLFSPNINFYFHPESLPGQFVYDSHYSASSERSLAIKTSLPVTTEHLGIRGIVGEVLSHPAATRKLVLKNLKDPQEVAYVSACILGAIVFSNFAKNDLDSILKADPAKTVPQMTKYMIKKTPELKECLESIGLKSSKAVFDITVNIIKTVSKFAINILK